jgi:phage gpG-like protein
MITVSANISAELTQLVSALQQAANSRAVTRAVASTLVPIVRNRIHVEGRAADGSQIGTYSEEYMQVRTGKFQSNGTYKSGKRKGETRDTGAYTRGPRKGQPRIQYNRTDDKTVVFSLTRQMENDFSVVETEVGYGLGFKNVENSRKAEFCEKVFKKVVYALTSDEQYIAADTAIAYVTQQLP